ncbi:MAG: HAD-IB family phosphatase [Candidatus Aenigmarchaeota archaeon]|nr:HAD-IB family phosphatase [Candidatus Aenigmarchaeota archaeon]
MHVICFDFDDVLVDGNILKKMIGSHGNIVRELELGAELLEDNQNPKKFFATVKQLVALGKGVPLCDLEQLMRGLRLTTGAKPVLKQLDAHRYKIAIVSTNDESLIRLVLKKHRIDQYIDHVYAAHLGTKNGTLTGTISGDVIKTEKTGVVKQIEKKYNTKRKQITYIGDGLTDIPIMKLVGHGIFFNPSLITRAEIYTNKTIMKKIQNKELFLAEGHDLREILKFIQ